MITPVSVVPAAKRKLKLPMTETTNGSTGFQGVEPSQLGAAAGVEDGSSCMVSVCRFRAVFQGHATKSSVAYLLVIAMFVAAPIFPVGGDFHTRAAHNTTGANCANGAFGIF